MDAGTVLGGVSLAIQLLGGCLKGYEIIDSALEMPTAFRYLSVQFHIEHWRLRDFGQTAGLLNNGNVLDGNIQATSSLLLAVFQEIDNVLECLCKDAAVQEDGPQGGVAETYRFLMRPRSLTDEGINPPGKFQQLKWSLSRKDKFEQLLQRLRQSNDFLHQLLGKQQAQMLHDKQQETCMALVQARDSLDELQTLAQAARLSPNSPNSSIRWQQDVGLELENLAAFKAFYVSLLKASKKGDEEMRINPTDIIFEDHLRANQNPQCARAALVTAGAEPKKVLVNWKSMPDVDLDADQTSLSLVEELTALLMAPKPSEFCIPPCLGYCEIVSEDSTRKLGLIFDNPPQVDQQRHPISLLEAIAEITRPSLTQRVALAQNIAHCLLYLHSVNWLHKGLRSENILLFSSPDEGAVIVTSPYLIGFEYSRRARFNEATIEAPRVGSMEVYRHPDIQANGLGSKCYYRKTFDIYSLGIVLIEIAHWKPIASILGIEDTIDAFPKATSEIRERILSSESGLLASLRGEVGDQYASAVETCIAARDAFGVSRLDLETDTCTSTRIQHEYNVKVVRMLRGILI